MKKPYLLIKVHLNEYYWKQFSDGDIPNVEESKHHSEDFPGEWVCLYDLQATKYLEMAEDNVPYGLDSHIYDIIKQKKKEYLENKT